MFKRKISRFFANSSGEDDLTPEEEDSAWRKNISPLPSFLLNPRKSQKKNILSSNGDDFIESSENKDILSREKSPGLSISSSKNEMLYGDRLSSLSFNNLSKGYTFTMTKLSIWTVAFSLFFLGVLFFIIGFLVALYLVGSKPSLVSKIEHTVPLHDKFLVSKEETPPPVTPHPQTTQTSPETGSLNFKTNSASPQDSGNSISLAPAPSTPPTASQKMPPVAQNSVSPPPSSSTSQSTPTSKLSPLQKKNPLNLKKIGANPTLFSLYSLQFGSFSTKDEALKRVNILVSNGYNCLVVRSVNNQNKLSFSVISGSYPTREEAEGSLQVLGRLEKTFSPSVVRNNPSAVIVYP